MIRLHAAWVLLWLGDACTRLARHCLGQRPANRIGPRADFFRRHR